MAERKVDAPCEGLSDVSAPFVKSLSQAQGLDISPSIVAVRSSTAQN